MEITAHSEAGQGASRNEELLPNGWTISLEGAWAGVRNNRIVPVLVIDVYSSICFARSGPFHAIPAG